MKFYYAPMEGVAGYVYRSAHNKFFDGIDKYFAPFIVADQTNGFRKKDINDILSENNSGLKLVPQILSNNAKDFIHTSKKIKELNYDEINLNLGCPSTIVVSKNRGSGFLALKNELKLFLDEIFSSPTTEISIKTRLGKEQHDEFYELIEIFNQYPIKELIIHPRIQTDIYNNKPNLKVFKDALSLSKNPVGYNGDIFTVKDFLETTEAFPEVNTFMIGRGLLANPGLVAQIKKNEGLDKSVLYSFHNQIYVDYQIMLNEDRKVLSKMKETWFYMIQAFSNYEAYFTGIRRSESLKDYETAVALLFNEQNILENFGYNK